MGKANSARARLASGGAPKESAFDFITAKPHHNVLGRRVKGLAVNAAVSRARGVENRKRTLGVQLAREGRASTFVDERFGEEAPGMSTEDKMLGRYKLAKKAKVSSRNSKFALGDDDDEGGGLTHAGQSLGDHNMGRWDEPSDEEGDDEKALSMGSARYVKELNFGGGVRDDDEEEVVKSRQEVMEEIIAKSKFYRAERHRVKQEQVETIEQLDADFDEVRGLLSGYLSAKRGAEPSQAQLAAEAAAKEAARKEKHSDYDALAGDLAMAPRARPASRLKTEEELLEAEAERLKRLEGERRARMNAELAAVGAGAADYKTVGRVLTDDDLAVNYKIDGDEDGDEGEEGEGECGSDEEEEEDDDDDDDDDEEDEADEEGARVLPSDRAPAAVAGPDEEEDDEEEEGGEAAARGATAAVRATAAAAELPYMPQCPTTGVELSALLALAQGSEEKEQMLLNRAIATNHVKLAAENKPRMGLLFELLLGRFAELAGAEAVRLRALDAMCAPLYTLSQMVPMGASERCKRWLAQLAADAERRERGAAKAAKRGAPAAAGEVARARARAEAAELLSCKLLFNLFPPSDRRHPVCTPAALLLARGLAAAPARPLAAASDALLLTGRCALLLHFCAAEGASRFAPELPPAAVRVGRALAASLSSCAAPSGNQARAAGAGARRARSLLEHTAEGFADASHVPLALPPSGGGGGGAKGGARTDALLDAAMAWAALAMDVCAAFGECASAPELAAALQAVGALGAAEAVVAEAAAAKVAEAVRVAVEERAPLALQRRVPVALSSIEPEFEESGRAAALDRPAVTLSKEQMRGATKDDKRTAQREMREAAALRGLHRREFKAATRELKKDAAFLAGERHRRKSDLDKELEASQKHRLLPHPPFFFK
ncbi:nucleolar protein 14 [Pavlovales sp. CCMP2436]|nr:nucleolar protein 14 [Pavlovales sp. CCMP2436]